MAAHTGVLACTGTLGAGVADTFDLSGNTDEVLITNHGNVAGVIYVRADGTAAAVAADECSVILGGQIRRYRSGHGGNPPTFSIISSAAITVTVEGA